MPPGACCKSVIWQHVPGDMLLNMNESATYPRTQTSCNAGSAAALQRVCRLQGKRPEDKCSRWHELWTQNHARTIWLQPRASRQRSRRRTCKAPRCGNPLRVALMSSMQRRIAVYFPDVPAPARCRTFKRGIASELSIATAACRKESHANDG